MSLIVVAPMSILRGSLVLGLGENIMINAISATRLMLLGGEPLKGLRYIWWSFVASRKETIGDAKRVWQKADWVNGRFTLPSNDNEEFVPMPRF